MTTKIAFIDCGISQSETPDRILERLEVDGEGIEVAHNPRAMDGRDFLTIRWGSTRFSDLDRLSKDILNKANAIQFNIRKDLAHRKMLEAGVSTPLLWSNFNEARTKSRELGCDFLRRKKHHHQGLDIIRLSPSDHLSQAMRHGYYVQ